MDINAEDMQLSMYKFYNYYYSDGFLAAGMAEGNCRWSGPPGARTIWPSVICGSSDLWTLGSFLRALDQGPKYLNITHESQKTGLPWQKMGWPRPHPLGLPISGIPGF